MPSSQIVPNLAAAVEKYRGGEAAAGFHRPRIALLSDGVSPWVIGGIQRHSRMLAIHLAREGADVDLFHTTHTAATRAEAESLSDFPPDVRAAIRSHVVGYPQPGRLPGHYIDDSRRYSENLLRRYRAERIDADFVYAQGLTGLAFTQTKRRQPDSLPPVGINQHGYEMFQRAADWKTYLQHLVLRPSFARLAREADVVFAFPGRIDEIVRHRLGVSTDRIVTIPNAVDESWIVNEKAPSSGIRRFVFLGRHERRKGVPELLGAISSLDRRDFEFHFIGPIPEESRLRRPHVVYHGAIVCSEAIQRLLDDCDVLVCPSFAEGMPTVVLEGMARGLAIIATDVGATREWVDAANGVLLPSPDSLALAQAMDRLLSISRAEIGALQQASLVRARACTWPRVAAMTLQAIRRIVGKSIDSSGSEHA
jgi:glycosyltransferase involved in cell wall biosynthesis